MRFQKLIDVNKSECKVGFYFFGKNIYNLQKNTLFNTMSSKKILVLNLDQKIDLTEVLSQTEHFPDFVKGVADINKNLLALGGSLHADAEEELIKIGSNSDDIWGFNLYKKSEYEIVYDSLINIKPKLNNKSMSISDSEIKAKIFDLIKKIVQL
jgi:hypothetical protein